MTPSPPNPSLDNPAIQPFLKKLSGDWKLFLLEKGTCTYRAGERFAQAAFEHPPKIVEVANFEEAVNRSKAPKSIMLLPHLATPHVAAMETSHNRVTLHDFTFRYSNPPLYLAGLTNDAKGSCAAIVHLENLATPEDGITNWVNVDNTQAAAIACANRKVDLCITNEYGLKKHNLQLVRELKKMEPTWFAYSWSGV